jgi:capsular exopolysaccharide synthesis family protein
MATAPEPSDDTPVLKPLQSAPDPFELDDNPGSSVSVEQFLRLMRRYKWSILAVTLLSATLGLMNALSAVPLYLAEARVLVSYAQPNIASMNQFETAPLHWLFYKTQADIIKSHVIAERVAQELLEQEIGQEPAVAAVTVNPAPPGALEDLRRSWAEIKREWLPDWRDWLPGVTTPVAATETLSDQDRRANRIRSGLDVFGGEESEVLVIRFESADPGYAARVVNTTAQAYIDFGLESRVSSVQQATRWLGDRIEVLRKTLEESELALREFQAREGMVGSTNREQIISSKLATLSAELIRAQTRRSEAEARYQQVRSLSDESPDYEALSTVLDSELVLDAGRSKKSVDARVAELSERYGSKHPKMVAVLGEQREADRRLKTELRKAVSSLRKEFEIARAQEKHFTDEIETQQAQMRAVSGKAFELDALEKEVEANRRIYETFLERFKQAEISNDYNVSNVRVIDPAQVPVTPHRPNKQRTVLSSVLIGLVAGLLLAFFRSQLDRTFKIKEDIENVLRLPVLGMVPKMRQRPWQRVSLDSFVRDEPRTAFAEAVNDIRTAILFSKVDERPKVVLVTSAVPGEGKTALASNLALSFGQRGRTLLLEGDLRKGRLNKVLERQERTPGISDVVSGQCELKDAMVRFPDTDNVYVLTHGTPPPNPLELLSSRRFLRCLDSLKSSFDHIIIDGSPLLPVSDSVVLGDLADVVVLTVQSERTTHPVAREAVKRLAAARIRPNGVVLQQVDFRRLHAYHGDHAGYGRYYAYRGYYGESG